ncbi:hypothetical protein QFC22_001763 [Naganishia vaughanmartiniae]|uniref:Uncharacterized protein n=1 Tax=Naganishia vaughanmartiniae TaxID=1424756 RepID=A0ACC2XHZ9_9TREE|nr:hypothetical protein QFC22_001763 [Naganishia vaughanmartiniae]
MASDLPIDPVVDSPVFRASLASLDAKTHTIQKKCKNALQAALAVSELLEKLEAAESELFDTLDELKQQIVKVDSKGKDGLEHTQAEAGVVKDLKAWKRGERMEERQQLETLVTSRVKALQMDFKAKGLGGGGALNTFEDQARSHYQAVGKYLLPSTSSKYDNDRQEARQSAANTDYALNMYTMHSQLLWSTPPYSPPCLELGICLNLWLSGVISEGSSASPARSPAGPSANVQSPDQMTPDARAAIDPSPGAPFPGTRRRLRTLSQKSSMPTLLTASPSTVNLVIQPLKSVSSIKQQLRKELEYMDYQKQVLERDWAERERQKTLLSSISTDVHQQATQLDNEHTNSKRQSFQSSRPDSSAKLQAIDEAGSPAHSKRMKKVGGMGKRLRGMIQSASFSANLSLKSMTEPSHEPSSPSSPFPAPQKSMQLDTSSTSSSQVMTRPQPEKRHSFAASSSSRPTSYSSPFLPSPILPANEDGFPSEAEMFSPSLRQALQPPGGGNRMDVSKQAYRDLQSRTGNQVLEDEIHRESAGRKREGMLWTSGIWEDVATSSNKGGDRKERAKWEHCWVVLAGCKLYEYRDALSRKPELDHETIDLQFANARQGRETDRRFTFEIVTPQHGKRMYQTTSYEDMKSWIYAICNAIESSINGTSTLRVAIPNHPQLSNYADDYGQPSRLQSSGIGLGLPSSAKLPLNESFNAAPIDPSWTKAIERRTSFKDAFRSRANLALHSSRSPDDRSKFPGHKRGTSKGSREIHHAHTHSLDVAKAGAMRRSQSSLSVPGAAIGFLNPGSRQSSRSSKSSKRSSLMSIGDESAPGRAVGLALRPVEPIPFPVMSRSGSFYQLELDDDMRNAVLHADPIATSPETSYHIFPTPYQDAARELAPSETMTQERFHDALASIPTPSPPADMVLLRKIANQPGNQTCSDCGHPIKGETSQRWATISIHNNPQVLFLCIRCAGVHRSFGTHISKVRSPDLDKWSDEAILTARAWGNARGNQIWERHKPTGAKPRDDSLAALHEYIENKYVKGIWLSDEDRQFYLDEQAGIAL